MGIPINIPCETVMDSIADGVFTVDRDWNITFFNKAAEEITTIPAEEAVGRKCWEVFRSSVCDGECALRACVEGGFTLSSKSIFIVRPDGTRVPISISAAPLKDAMGNHIGGVETFRDLSDLALLRKEVEGRFQIEDIVGKSLGLRRAFALLPQVAESGATVLVTGESGTGKELFARALHTLSARKEKPFVAVNCGALPESLLESELFGYKAGAFTDAKKDKPGRFALAEGGTLFLDEIGDMPPSVQVKLLRVLQERVYEPLGGVEPLSADVRIIAATNRDLDALVADKTFRDDLFYRLNVVRIAIPPLRERAEDLPLLVDHFIARFNALRGKDIQGMSEDVQALFARHDWPGNVRELENVIEYAFILCPSGFIQLDHLPEQMQPGPRRDGPGLPDRPMTMDEVKARAARAAVERHQGKKMAACRELGITKDTLRRLLAMPLPGEK